MEGTGLRVRGSGGPRTRYQDCPFPSPESRGVRAPILRETLAVATWDRQRQFFCALALYVGGVFGSSGLPGPGRGIGRFQRGDGENAPLLELSALLERQRTL